MCPSFLLRLAAATSVLLLVSGCSSSSTPGSTVDAGVDASLDASEDVTTFLDAPVLEDGETIDVKVIVNDAESPCDEMAQSIAMLETTARACNPSLPNQCNAAAQGPCCPITVDVSSTDAVANLAAAVMSYVMLCAPTCGTCTNQTPSKRCLGAGSEGTCE